MGSHRPGRQAIDEVVSQRQGKSKINHYVEGFAIASCRYGPVDCELWILVSLSLKRVYFYLHSTHSLSPSVLVKRIHITKRDLFYTDVKLFVDQAESDGVLDDVATMIGCTRSNLHVVASDKGLVVGRIQFTEDGDYIDCTKMGVGGKAIPPYIDKIEDITSDAEFILLVEKEAAYMRMAVRSNGKSNKNLQNAVTNRLTVLPFSLLLVQEDRFCTW